jgi:hypothetical protein
MEHQYHLIKEISEDFVSQTYQNQIPDGYCFSMCYSLSVLFSLMEIKHELTFGKSLKNNMEISHFWITMDNNETILDPTIKQFNPNELPVYFGNIQENETTSKYIKIENIGDQEFSQTYGLWAEPLLQNKPLKQLPPGLENKLISFNVAAAYVLMSHIHKLDLKEKLLNSGYALSYFKPISAVLRNNYTIDLSQFDLNYSLLKYGNEIQTIH